MINWYVSSLAGGGGNGTEGNPWTLAEAIININNSTVQNGDTVWLKNDGIYTTSGIIISVPGAYNAYKRISGYDTIIEDGGRVIIRRSGGISNLFYCYQACWTIENLELDGQNTGQVNLYIVNSDIIKNVCSHNAGTIGLYGDAYFINCCSYSNLSDGFYAGHSYNSIAYNNSGIGFNFIYSTHNCISRNNTIGNFSGRTAGGTVIMNCIGDGGNGHGIDLGTCNIVFNCVIKDSPTGKEGIYFSYTSSKITNKVFNINFDNCNSKSNYINNIDTYYELNSQFKNPNGFDYTRTGTNLDDKGFSEIGMVNGINYYIDLGIDQKITEDYPSEDDVRKDIEFNHDNKIGKLDLPSIHDVEENVKFDQETKSGEFIVPAEAEVKKNTDYGYNEEFTGTLQTIEVGNDINLSIDDGAIDLSLEVE